MVKKKFLSKMMMVALVICSMFLISACSWQKDVNIKSIEVIEESVPAIIRVGEFDNAGIEMLITYEDNSTETVNVTSELIPQDYLSCLETPGIYEIEIFFKGEKAILNITIVEVETYMVEFYNGKQQLIERQFVKSGEDAVAPDASAYAMYGYEFVGWDRLFTDVSEDIKVYSVYSKLSTEDMNALVHEKMVNALTYMYSHDYVVTLAEDNGGQLIYHFDEESQMGFSQALGYSDGEISYVQNSSIEKIEIYETNEATGEWQTEIDDLSDEELTEEQGKLAVMFGGEMGENLFRTNTEYTYSYMLAENRNVYTVEAKYEFFDEISQQVGYIETLVLTFDDEKILSVKLIGAQEPDYEEEDFEYLVDYRTQEFETIEDQDLFLLIYNEARTNVLAQTTLRYEEIEVDGGYYIVSNIADNKLYEYTEYNEEFFRKDWVQQEQDRWIEYSSSASGSVLINEKFDISEDVESDNAVAYAVGRQCVEFDDETIAMVDRFECYFENGYTKLTLTIVEDGYEMQMIYHIENGLITKIEEYIPDESPMMWIFSYNPEDVEMVELPTDIQWTEN